MNEVNASVKTRVAMPRHCWRSREYAPARGLLWDKREPWRLGSVLVSEARPRPVGHSCKEFIHRKVYPLPVGQSRDVGKTGHRD